MSVIAVFEGDTDLPIVRKLADDADLSISLELDAAGKAHIDRELVGYNAAVRGNPWFVLRDLDRDADCAPKFLESIGFFPSEWMCFRLAVREAEAWLLAEEEAIAEYFRVRRDRVPANPDGELHPKRALVELARQSSSKAIRKAMVPRGSAKVGPQYEATVIEFGMTTWNLVRACRRSPSLTRGRSALRALAARWQTKAGGAAGP